MPIISAILITFQWIGNWVIKTKQRMNCLSKQCYHFQESRENIKNKSNVSNLSTQMSPDVEEAGTVSDIMMWFRKQTGLKIESNHTGYLINTNKWIKRRNQVWTENQLIKSRKKNREENDMGKS